MDFAVTATTRASISAIIYHVDGDTLDAINLGVIAPPDPDDFQQGRRQNEARKQG